MIGLHASKTPDSKAGGVLHTIRCEMENQYANGRMVEKCCFVVIVLRAAPEQKEEWKHGVVILIFRLYHE